MKKFRVLIIIGILYFSICIVYSLVSNRIIFYTHGSKYGDCKIYENGKVIVERSITKKIYVNGKVTFQDDKESKEFTLDNSELKELKKIILNDRKEYSKFTYPTSDDPNISVDKVVWSYGYYYYFFSPFIKNKVYDGESSKYVFELLENLG